MFITFVLVPRMLNFLDLNNKIIIKIMIKEQQKVKLFSERKYSKWPGSKKVFKSYPRIAATSPDSLKNKQFKSAKSGLTDEDLIQI